MTMEIAMVMKMSMAAVITTATKISMMMLSQPAPLAGGVEVMKISMTMMISIIMLSQPSPLADLYKLLLPAVIALLHPHSP